MLGWRRGVMLVGLVVTLWGVAAYSARAELERALLSRTASLFALAPHWMVTVPRTLVLNGARLVVATGSSEQPLAVLLDHLQAACRQHSGGFHDAARRLVERRSQELPSLLDGVLRVEAEREGMVACLDLGKEPLSADAWSERLARLAERGDLSALGGLRVVRARAQGSGSFFVAVWNDGALPLADMFPRHGEAPGVDPPGLPRPADARRILSAWQEQAETSIHVYRVGQGPEQAFAEYTAQLEARGFAIGSALPLQSRERLHAGLLVRGGTSLVVLAQADGVQSLVSVMPMNGGAAMVRTGR